MHHNMNTQTETIAQAEAVSAPGADASAASPSPEPPPAAPPEGTGAVESPPEPGSYPGSPAAPVPLAPAPGESDRAFEAYRVYLELGPRRRYSAVVREVGSSLRTIKRWAYDFDWRGRIQACAAQGMERYVENQREQFADAAARDQEFRDHQYDVAEAMLDAAGNFFELLDDDDRDAMSFGDACKALEVSARVGQQASSRSHDDGSAAARGLHDQLEQLLDQAYGDKPPSSPSPQPSTTVLP